MVKDNDLFEDVSGLTFGLVGGGAGLTLGSATIGALPTTPASAPIQQGFSTAAGFFPTIATIGAAGITFKQLSKIEKQMKGGLK